MQFTQNDLKSASLKDMPVDSVRTGREDDSGADTGRCPGKVFPFMKCRERSHDSETGAGLFND